MTRCTPLFVGGSGRQRPGAGGHAWALAHWAAGLRQAGHTVDFLDQGTGSAGLALRPVLAEAGVGHVLLGDDADSAVSARADAPWVLNIMGFITSDAAHDDKRSWAFLDIDPGYPQMWHELGLADMFAEHGSFVTIGENIGRPGCTIPDCGLDWITTPPPVLLDAWPPSPGGDAFTTVGAWRNAYGTVTWNGTTYGSRVHEFRKFLELPRLVDAEFELALDIHEAEVDDLRRLEANGWRLVDPKAVAGTPNDYRSYVQSARAEFSVAQNMYVATRSGWLSDRSLCYLASGKPVLAQDTGFSDNYPVGEGLLAFSTLEEAAAGVEEIECNYARHSRAARSLAEEYFDSAKVLGRLLEQLGIQEASTA
jgi:hypothetical protein